MSSEDRTRILKLTPENYVTWKFYVTGALREQGIF